MKVTFGLTATAYHVDGTRDLEIVRRDLEKDSWAIISHGMCFGRDGKWSHEPLPSNRSEEWLANHRFTFEEASNPDFLLQPEVMRGQAV